MDIKQLNGIFNREQIDRLTWPIAWNGAPDREYEANLAALVEEAREALRENGDASAVEIRDGRVVAVCE
jgi:hypothetical protein